jgi:capsular exopolysaccharide synthesis family protein
LFLGLGIVWLIGRYDDRILTVSDIEDLIDEQVLGLVPVSTSELRDAHVGLLVEEDRRHSFAESFRNIRSSILFVKGEGTERKTILVTSAVPSEGKSTVAANLAAVLAMGGARVLLIDGDLRRGTVHEIAGADRQPGLSDYLTDPTRPDPIRPTSLPRLSIIPAGKPVTNSGELFLGNRFRELMDRAKSEFDHVVVDSPPVFAADDATTLAPRFDATLFVTRSAFTRGRMAHRALTLLRQRNSRILGVVLNRASAAAKSYYYGYSHYYHGTDGAKPTPEPSLRFGNPVGGGKTPDPQPPAGTPEARQPRND